MTKKASPWTPLCDRPDTAGLSAARSQPYGKQDGPDGEDLEQDAREGAYRLPGPRRAAPVAVRRPRPAPRTRAPDRAAGLPGRSAAGGGRSSATEDRPRHPSLPTQSGLPARRSAARRSKPRCRSPSTGRPPRPQCRPGSAPRSPESRSSAAGNRVERRQPPPRASRATAVRAHETSCPTAHATAPLRADSGRQPARPGRGGGP